MESSLLQRLRAAGLRATGARSAVIKVLEERRQHLSADDIHKALSGSGWRVDLSSVYRTLTLLVRLGLVRLVGPSERHGHFEVEHDECVHFVCARCGAVTEANLAQRARVERMLRGLARGAGFGLKRFMIEASGECAACAGGGKSKPGIAGAAQRGPQSAKAGARSAQR